MLEDIFNIFCVKERKNIKKNRCSFVSTPYVTYMYILPDQEGRFKKHEKNVRLLALKHSKSLKLSFGYNHKTIFESIICTNSDDDYFAS